MDNGAQPLVDRDRLLELKACLDEEPSDDTARAIRDRIAIELLERRGFTVQNGMVIDKTGATPQMVPVIKKARRIVNLALQLVDCA